MKRWLALAAVAMVAGLGLAADKADALQVGEEVEAFHVKDVTGPAAGTELCYRCRFLDRPVVSIFAKEVNDELAALIKEVDATVGKNTEKEMAAFVVVLSDEPAAQEDKLKEVAKKQGLKHVPLTTFNDATGPRSYKLSRDADVTVMMWVNGTLQVNEAYKKGQLSKEKIAGVVQNTSKILN
jgi:hypothetical protein